MNIPPEQFEELVNEALDSLSDNFKERLHNVAILIDDEPTKEQLKKLHVGRDYELYGLFEGFAQSRRLNFGVVPPDRITIFRKSIMKNCSTEEEIKNQVYSTVKHEIAHHFGSDEAGARKASRKN